MKITTMIAFSAGAISSAMVMQAAKKAANCPVVSVSTIRNKIMKMFE